MRSELMCLRIFSAESFRRSPSLLPTPVYCCQVAITLANLKDSQNGTATRNVDGVIYHISYVNEEIVVEDRWVCQIECGFEAGGPAGGLQGQVEQFGGCLGFSSVCYRGSCQVVQGRVYY